MNTAAHMAHGSPPYTREQTVEPDWIEAEPGCTTGSEGHAFRSAPWVTRRAEDELRLVASVETRLRAIYPCEVTRVRDGIFTVGTEAPLLWEARLVKEYNDAVKTMHGVKGISVHIAPSSLYGLG